MTNRQLQYKKNRITGMSPYAAARAAGYSPNYAGNRIAGGRIDKEIQFEIEKAGGTLKFVAEKLVKFAEKDDFRAAIPALKQLCELLGLNKEAKIVLDQSQHLTQVKNETNNIIQTFDAKSLADKIKELNGPNTNKVTEIISNGLGLQVKEITPGA